MFKFTLRLCDFECGVTVSKNTETHHDSNDIVTKEPSATMHKIAKNTSSELKSAQQSLSSRLFHSEYDSDTIIPTPRPLNLWSAHHNGNTDDIADIVIVSSNGQRIEAFANNYMHDTYPWSGIRNMKNFTGYANGIRVTVMSIQMGSPSEMISMAPLIDLYKKTGIPKCIVKYDTCATYGSNDFNVEDFVCANPTYPGPDVQNYLRVEDKPLQIDANMLKVANDAGIKVASCYSMLMYEGTIVTDDKENAKQVKSQPTQDIATMETFTLQQQCHLANLPYLPLFSVSDNIVDSTQYIPANRRGWDQHTEGPILVTVINLLNQMLNK